MKLLIERWGGRGFNLNLWKTSPKNRRKHRGIDYVSDTAIYFAASTLHTIPHPHHVRSSFCTNKIFPVIPSQNHMWQWKIMISLHSQPVSSMTFQLQQEGLDTVRQVCCWRMPRSRRTAWTYLALTLWPTRTRSSGRTARACDAWSRRWNRRRTRRRPRQRRNGTRRIIPVTWIILDLLASGFVLGRRIPSYPNPNHPSPPGHPSHQNDIVLGWADHLEAWAKKKSPSLTFMDIVLKNAYIYNM